MLQLKFEDNGTFHDDLTLVFPGGEYHCDTYYYLIDPEDESLTKLRRVIRTMLTQWVSVIKQAANVDTVYLPFDFSDEYTGWIRCQFNYGSTQLEVGWSSIPGYSFSPADIVDMVRKVTDFQAIENSYSVMTKRELLVAAIKANIRDYE